MSTNAEHSSEDEAGAPKATRVQQARQKAEFILSRAWGLARNPGEEWDQIRREETTVASIMLGYVAPLAAIWPVCDLIGSVIFGRILNANYADAIVRAGVTFVVSVGVVFLLGLLINAAAENFDADRDDLASQKVAAYSMTPYFFSGLFSLWPPLWWLGIFAVAYSGYLIYRGLPVLMKAPEDRVIGYTATVAVSGFVAFMILFGLVACVTGPASL
jgi:Yip1 domain